MPGAPKLRKVTVLLPEDLIERAKSASGHGLTPTLREGLEKLIEAKAVEDAIALRGKMKFSIDFDELRREDR